MVLIALYVLLVESEQNPIGLTIQINETLSFFFYSFSFFHELKNSIQQD